MTEARIIRKEITRKLTRDYDEAELAGLHDELLSALNKQAALEGEKAIFNETIKGKLKPVLAAIESTRQKLNAGHEIADVDCEEVFNFQGEPSEIAYRADNDEEWVVLVPANSVAVVRLDTKELVGEPREITDKERQTSFLGQEQPPAEETTGEKQEYPECNRLDLRAAHCGQCDDEDCGGCCWGCTHHLEQGEQPSTCRHPAGAQAPQEAA